LRAFSAAGITANIFDAISDNISSSLVFSME
jgi:hypothetical protein